MQLLNCYHFNPRSREGSDFYESRANRFTRISIHAPARGATFTLLLQIINYSYFNPRSREGSDAILPPFLLYSSNFNPRSREGSDPHDCLRPHAQSISIHAPARGATSCSPTVNSKIVISIHAPARGATVLCSSNQQPVAISIHAPARGATVYNQSVILHKIISIHAPARGATLNLYKKNHHIQFQSTLPRGERRTV